MIGISAILTAFIALVFTGLGFFIPGPEDLTGKYFFIAASALALIAFCFSVGLFQLKNHKPNGRIWIIAASLILITILAASTIQIATTSTGWKLTLLTILVSLLAITPFVWLIYYLWNSHKNQQPS